MKVIAQPESYSDMLERVFTTTVASGIICTLIIASASPTLKTLIDSVKIEAEIGPVKGMPLLVVFVPITIGMVLRIVYFHDWISNRLRIRFTFDTRYILLPMAQLSGHKLDENMEQRIRSARESAMHRVFYPYADCAEPTIDRQLVRTALDNWGWFWAEIESGLLFTITAIIVWVMERKGQFWICLASLLAITFLLLITWFACRRSADRQVRAIIDDPQRKTDIQAYFATICENPDKQPIGESDMAITDSSKPVTKKTSVESA
jgi:hypothetical protein